MFSEKKIFQNPLNCRVSIDYIADKVKNYRRHFRSHRFDNTTTAINYVLGLIKCPKGEANLERMEEEIDKSEYRAYQQFISNSNWDCQGLQDALAKDASDILSARKKKNGLPTGYIIDESAHLKKGEMSVGVSRQYAGVAGKVDNCQIGVYTSLVNDKYATIINQRLFLPEKWTNDTERCNDAGIPKDFQIFKTKPELAIDMLKQDIVRGVKFDWIGGDGLYGHSYQMCKEIDELSLFFVMDVHKDEKVFLQEPSFLIPEKKQGPGRTPTKTKADKQGIRLDKLCQQLSCQDWKVEQIRDSTKGKINLYVYKAEVWSWDTVETSARKRTLIITKAADKTSKIKYSFSNGGINEYTHQQYGYFVAQRYWVERAFDNAKNELGMSDYQVRKWKSWHHHHSLVFLTSLFIMKQLIDIHPEVPLMSFRDTRILIILQVFGTRKEVQLRLEQMAQRHRKRQLDINYCYKKQRTVQQT